MRKVRWLLLVAVILFGGCLPATQTEVLELTGEISRLLVGVDALQDTTEQIAADGLVSSENVDRMNASIDKVQEHIEIVVANVETAEDPVDAIEKGWKASEPFNPYYGYGAAILAVLRIMQVGRQKRQTETALEEVVVGVENGGKNDGSLKDALRASESLATKNMVSVIRNRLA